VLSSKIYHKSSEAMDELQDGTVALTVTSPPYWNAIDYDRHSGDGGEKWYRSRTYGEGYAEYDEYLNWLTGILGEVFRVTRPGGHCAIVIGTVLLSGKHYPAPMDLTSRMTAAGWEFRQDIIWHKTTAGVRRAGSVIQKPYPGYYYPNIMTEYILVFRRPGEPLFAGRGPEARAQSEIAIDDVFKHDIANNVWHIAPVPPGHLEHPCPFPEEIPYRLTKLYSYVGDIVLDPFVGSGQTTKVAHHLGRIAVGYDTKLPYVQYAAERLSEPLRLRRKQLVARFEHVGAHANDAPRELPTQEGLGQLNFGITEPVDDSEITIPSEIAAGTKDSQHP
jgi:site-specific DNA-methyltransferase (adenine-specific)